MPFKLYYLCIYYGALQLQNLYLCSCIRMKPSVKHVHMCCCISHDREAWWMFKLGLPKHYTVYKEQNMSGKVAIT